MPCKNSSALMTVHLDAEDRLRDYAFNKITCRKDIGCGKGYQDYCAGKPAQEILGHEFSQLVEILNLTDTEEQFLVYLEWDALRSALLQYYGRHEDADRERYKIASVDYDEAAQVEIQLVIYPPEDMPKIESCHSRARKEGRN